MMSGIRKLPPISINSPRETMASRPFADGIQRQHERRRAVVDDERVFGAGQFTQQFARSARTATRARRARYQIPHSRILTRLGVTASMAAGASGARPRFVWSTTPVPLRTRRSDGRVDCSTAADTASAQARGSRRRCRRRRRAPRRSFGGSRRRQPSAASDRAAREPRCCRAASSHSEAFVARRSSNAHARRAVGGTAGGRRAESARARCGRVGQRGPA